jgi:hypothetical protein
LLSSADGVDDDASRRARAKARASLPGRKLRLEELPEVELVEGLPGDLIGMVTELTRAAWAMSGEPLPRYTRAQMPGRIIRNNGDGS